MLIKKYYLRSLKNKISATVCRWFSLSGLKKRKVRAIQDTVFLNVEAISDGR